MYTVYYYPNCNTCKKAIKFLEEKGIKFKLVHLVEDTPSAAGIEALFKLGDYPIKKFFNTSGRVYRELNLKEKIINMKNEDASEILSSDGMLIKRPIITNGKDMLIIGFKESEWNEKIKNI